MARQLDQAGNGFYSGISALIGVILINSYSFLGYSWLVVLGIAMLGVAVILAFLAIYKLLGDSKNT